MVCLKESIGGVVGFALKKTRIDYKLIFTFTLGVYIRKNCPLIYLGIFFDLVDI